MSTSSWEAGFCAPRMRHSSRGLPPASARWRRRRRSFASKPPRCSARRSWASITCEPRCRRGAACVRSSPTGDSPRADEKWYSPVRSVKILLRGPLHGAGNADGVLVDGDMITWVGQGRPPERPDEEVIAGPGESIAPGFIDLQVNGYAGHDAAAGTDSIAAVSKALPATGVTAFLPTLISAPVEVGAAFAHAVGAAAEAPGARVLGAHIEGPFLNPLFRGAHLRENLAEPTPQNVD